MYSLRQLSLGPGAGRYRKLAALNISLGLTGPLFSLKVAFTPANSGRTAGDAIDSTAPELCGFVSGFASLNLNPTNGGRGPYWAGDVTPRPQSGRSGLALLELAASR
jgi:hypothetical protein